MRKIAEGISDFGDYKAAMFETADGRHFVRIEHVEGLEKPRIQWLSGNEYLEWLRVWSSDLGFSK